MAVRLSPLTYTTTTRPHYRIMSTYDKPYSIIHLRYLIRPSDGLSMHILAAN